MSIRKREYRAECGVRFLERYVETATFRGRRNVIETVAEDVGYWENAPIVYRYAVHWLYDFDTLEIEWYDKLPANEDAGRYQKLSIPDHVWNRMYGMALSFLNVEETRNVIESCAMIVPHDGVPRITVKFRQRQWSGFVLTYGRTNDGKVRLLESKVTIPATDERARRGHTRIPRVLCELSYDLAVRHFEGTRHEGLRQQALDLTLPHALI